MPFKLHNNHKIRARGHIELSPGWHAKGMTKAGKEHVQLNFNDGQVHHVPILKTPATVAGNNVRVVTFNSAKHYVHPTTGVLTKLPSGSGKKGGKGTKYDGTAKLRQRKYKVDEPGDEWEHTRGKPTFKSTSEKGINLIER